MAFLFSFHCDSPDQGSAKSRSGKLVCRGQRTLAKQSRISLACSAGCSQAAKWPPGPGVCRTRFALAQITSTFEPCDSHQFNAHFWCSPEVVLLIAAVREDDFSREPARIIRGKKYGHARDVLGLADAAQ